MATMRKWPTELWDFATIRERQEYYVDKTDAMWQLANSKTLVFLSRPRRFGKSMLITTLQCYFEGRKELFEGLKAERLQAESGEEWPKHPVLRFDMAGSVSSVESLQTYLRIRLDDIEGEYGLQFPGDKTLLGDRFGFLIEHISKKRNTGVVLLIDEYAAPLAHSIKDPAQHEAFKNVLRSFYSQMKLKLEYLRFVMLTGVSQFRQISVFSGLNNISDISLDPNYAAICGITEAELRENFDWRVGELAKKEELTKEEAYAKLKLHYDGFRFSEAEISVYNPFSIIRSLANLNFANYWYESGTPYVLQEVLPGYWYDFSQLDAGVRAEEPELRRFSPEEANPIPILFQTGYLTVGGFDRASRTYKLQFPNAEVKYSFWKGCIPQAFGPYRSHENYWMVKRMAEDMKQGKVDDFMEDMETLLSGIPYNLSYHNQPTREAQFQLAVFLLFKLAGRDVRAEVSSARGRSDIEVHTERIIYIFELKLKGKSKECSPREAIAQIRERGYDQPYREQGKRVVLIGMAFDGETKQFSWEVEG